MIPRNLYGLCFIAFRFFTFSGLASTTAKRASSRLNMGIKYNPCSPSQGYSENNCSTDGWAVDHSCRRARPSGGPIVEGRNPDRKGRRCSWHIRSEAFAGAVAGEVRTHRKSNIGPRHWRTRVDPFENTHRKLAERTGRWQCKGTASALHANGHGYSLGNFEPCNVGRFRKVPRMSKCYLFRFDRSHWNSGAMPGSSRLRPSSKTD